MKEGNILFANKNLDDNIIFLQFLKVKRYKIIISVNIFNRFNLKRNKSRIKFTWYIILQLIASCVSFKYNLKTEISCKYITFNRLIVEVKLPTN